MRWRLTIGCTVRVDDRLRCIADVRAQYVSFRQAEEWRGKPDCAVRGMTKARTNQLGFGAPRMQPSRGALQMRQQRSAGMWHLLGAASGE